MIYLVDRVLFFLWSQVACALVMSGEDLEKHTVVKDILVQMGVYFQVQVYYFPLNSWLVIVIFSRFLSHEVTFTLSEQALIL